MPFIKFRIACLITILLLVLPELATASEPCGPGLGVVVAVGVIALGVITSVIALILLLLQPRGKTAFNIFLFFSAIIHAAVAADLYLTIDYDENKDARLTAFLKLIVHPDESNGEFISIVMICLLSFWAVMITHLIWRARKKRKALID